MIPALPTLRDIIRIFKLKAKKDLSQNFLMDLNITDKIIHRTESKGGSFYGKTVLEVGPGPGSLTRSIVKAGCKNVVLVEKDMRFVPTLEMLKDAVAVGETNIHINLADALRVDENELLKVAGAIPKPWEEESDVVVVGNLPFSVSTELLIKWMHQVHHRTGAFAYGRTGMALMFQKEVAERIVAKPGCKDFNRLSIMVQHCCEASLIFNIGSKNFVPQPKVDASMVYIRPLVTPIDVVDIDALELICRLVFTQKRKIIGNAIKVLGNEAGVLLELSGIDQNLRAEEISVKDWCFLSKVFKLSTFYQKAVSLSQGDKHDKKNEKKKLKLANSIANENIS